eukprot:Pgem_evm1s18734
MNYLLPIAVLLTSSQCILNTHGVAAVAGAAVVPSLSLLNQIEANTKKEIEALKNDVFNQNRQALEYTYYSDSECKTSQNNKYHLIAVDGCDSKERIIRQPLFLDGKKKAEYYSVTFLNPNEKCNTQYLHSVKKSHSVSVKPIEKCHSVRIDGQIHYVIAKLVDYNKALLDFQKYFEDDIKKRVAELDKSKMSQDAFNKVVLKIKYPEALPFQEQIKKQTAQLIFSKNVTQALRKQHQQEVLQCRVYDWAKSGGCSNKCEQLFTRGIISSPLGDKKTCTQALTKTEPCVQFSAWTESGNCTKDCKQKFVRTITSPSKTTTTSTGVCANYLEKIEKCSVCNQGQTTLKKNINSGPTSKNNKNSTSSTNTNNNSASTNTGSFGLVAAMVMFY